MKKIAVVYSTKFGHTKTYADWLKEDVDADVMSVDSFNTTKLLAYKLTIFACGVYGDKLPIMDFIKKNLSAIPADKIMIMAVSWYTNDSEEATQKLIEENYPEQFKRTVPLYVVNSGLDKKKVPAMDKAKLIAAQMMIEKKDGRSSDDINALAIIKGYSDQTAKENLASIKKGIEEFFDPKKEEPIPAPAPKPAEPKPAPAASAAPAPKPVPVPEPAPVHIPEPAPAPEPVKAPEPVSAADESDDLSRSLDEAFKNLGMPKREPAPAQSNEEPVVRFNSSGQVVVSSVLDAINSLNGDLPVHTNKAEPAVSQKPAAPEPEVQPEHENIYENKVEEFESEEAPEPVKEAEPAAAEISSEPEAQPQQVSAPAQEAVQETAAAHEESNSHKNSYMELFASRRKKREEEAALSASSGTEAPRAAVIPEPKSEEPAPAPAAEIKPEPKPENKPSLTPVRSTAPQNDFTDFDLDISNTVSTASEFTFASSAPETAPEPAPATAEIDLDSYDFIGEDTRPTTSKRVLNAVQDLAKAKAEAEKEAARKAAERAAEEQAASQEESVQEEAPVQQQPYGSAHGISSEAESALERMKRDIEALAVESENDSEYNEESGYNDQYDNGSTDSDSEDGLEGFVFEEPSEDGLDAFAFADTHDYYAGKTSTPEIKRAEEATVESHTELDLRKLQEQINASIEANKINRERMQAKYGKREKEVVNNPFAVQFDDDSSFKGKKGKKHQPAAEPKRLADPIDPDIFFSKPNKSKEFNMISDSMPEITFKNR